MRESMRERLMKQLRDLARSMVGAFLLGLPLLYTMETWWLGWRLPAWLILLYVLGGLLVVSIVVHNVGFHQGEREKDLSLQIEIADLLDLFVASFLAGFFVLLLFGIIAWGETPVGEMVRLTLMQVVPLGLGAAITNRALAPAEKQSKTNVSFAREGAVFALGAIFFALPVTPTEEMDLMAAHAGPVRQILIVIAAIVLAYVALYVVEFRGRASRSAAASSVPIQIGETLTGYVIAFVLSALMLAGWGQFEDASAHIMVQKTVVLSFISSLGGAAARVVV